MPAAVIRGVDTGRLARGHIATEPRRQPPGGTRFVFTLTHTVAGLNGRRSHCMV